MEEENNIAKRPVLGLLENQIDKIQQQMMNLNHKIHPTYMPHISVEEVDKRNIIVIWCPTGEYRPYEVPEDVMTRGSMRKVYVRFGSTTIEAKNEILDEMRSLANRVPFDDRGNPEIKITDINPALVLSHLQKVGSRLSEDFYNYQLIDILDQMDLLVGPAENRWIKNVAAMMFCDHPEKFFKTTQVDIVIFPEGNPMS